MRQSSLRGLLDLPGPQGLLFGLFERLLLERFGLFFCKEPVRRFDDRRLYRTVPFDRQETKRVGTLAPVEQVGIARWFAPIDQ
ncbi:MAG: hypothetical protein HYU37_04905 [Acidobacteria bacterium]|nr:hypothetical protein [Acidobacteriota bacterium]